MAKVKQVKMRLGINPARLHEETAVCIHYDSTDRRTEQYGRPIPEERFYIVLPQVVADALGYEKVRATDQSEVMKRFEEALEKFKCLEAETNKVILYSFNVEPEPGVVIDQWNFGYKVSIQAGVFIETVMIAGDGTRRYSYEWIDTEINMGEKYGFGNRRNNGEREKLQVPATGKNFTFFLWVEKNMTLLMERLTELKQPDNLIEAIHAGRLLPLGNSEPGTT